MLAGVLAGSEGPPPAAALDVLLVEDEPVIRLLAAEILAEQGHCVREADCAEAALAALDGTDVLVTDIGLPDMDGLHLAEEARRLRPGLGIVIVSGQDLEPTTDLSWQWLEKPYEAAALAAAVARAVR